jgi:hypothetical protein
MRATIVYSLLTVLFCTMLEGCGNNTSDSALTGPPGRLGSNGSTEAGLSSYDAGVGPVDMGIRVPGDAASCTFVDGVALPVVGDIVGLEFTASSSVSAEPPPAVHVVVTNSAKAQEAFAATLALPDFPPGTYACPLDFGVRYQLTFFLANGTKLDVSANPSGCQQVSIPGTCMRRTADAGLMADDYWSKVSQDLGVPEGEIYPYSSSASPKDGG